MVDTLRNLLNIFLPKFRIHQFFTSSLLPATLTYLSEEPMGGVLMRAKCGSKVKAILVSGDQGLGHEAVKDHGSKALRCGG